MRKRALENWTWPDYKILRKCDGLGELRWSSSNIQYRLLGFVSGGVWYAVIGCTHKGKVYSPADALDTGKKYMKQINQGKADTVDYDFPPDDSIA